LPGHDKFWNLNYNTDHSSKSTHLGKEKLTDKYNFRSKGDLIIAGDILSKVQDLKSQGSVNEQMKTISQGSENEENGDKSQVSADEQSLKIGTSKQNIKTHEISAGMRIKMSRSKKATASIGSISSILGTSHARPSHPVKEKIENAKPLKIEVEKSVIDMLDVESSSSGFQGPKKESLSNREIEQLLFSMLGEGFKLSMDVIREVLGTTSTYKISSFIKINMHCRY
jgi:hypothetical protein